MTATGRLLMIGLDAVDRRFLEAHLDLLPHIARLFRDGVGGELESEPMSGSVWASFYSRSRPGDHGVFDQLQWDPATMRVRRSDNGLVPVRPFWRDLGEGGTPVITLDVPCLFPGPTPANVLEVTNWGSHDIVGPFWASDAGVGRRLRARFGRHPMGEDIPVPKTAHELARLRRSLIDGAALKGRLAAWLMAERPWRLFLLSFGELHRAGHAFGGRWGEEGEAASRADLLAVYQAVDRAVGAIAAAAGSETDVALFALHGMGPNISQCHLMPIFLQRAMARFRGEPAPAGRGDAPGLVRALRRRVPPRLQLAIARLTPKDLRDAVVAREVAGGYDWSKTLGFCLHGDVSGFIRLNIQGREATGALSAEEADSFRDFLRRELEALTLADGRKVVRRVSYPARDWAGPRSYLLPDVLVEWEPGIDPAEALRSPSLGVIRAHLETGRGGNHRFDPFYRLSGPRWGTAAAQPRHVCDLGDLVEALVQAR